MAGALPRGDTNAEKFPPIRRGNLNILIAFSRSPIKPPVFISWFSCSPCMPRWFSLPLDAILDEASHIASKERSFVLAVDVAPPLR